MLSFWEKKEFLQYDYLIVGAGIAGLSTACVLRERRPKAKILVLERGLLPTGASTKNAGFACIGSLSEKVYDLTLMGPEKLVQLVERRWQGLQLLRQRLGDVAIDFQPWGGYELILKKDSSGCLDQIELINELFLPLFKKPVFRIAFSKIAEFGFNSDLLQTIVQNDLEGQVDTGKMMSALYRYTASLGITILTGATVLGLHEEYDGVIAEAQSNLQTIRFKAQKVAVCTNAFTKTLFPTLEINPGRGQVLCTAPIPNLKIKGTFSFDQGFYYFRNFENRLIFGGGRNLDPVTEATTHLGSNPKIFEQLQQYLRDLILPGQNPVIESSWSGIMAFGPNKLPIIQRCSERIAVGVRFNGMGVALGSKVAEEVADLLMV